MNKTQPAAYELIISFVAPKALRAVAKKFKVSTGAIRVLNAIIYRNSQGILTCSAQLQAAKTATKPLLRANVAELIHAGLLERSPNRPWLRLTLEGMRVEYCFAQELRGALRALEQA